MKAQYTTKTQSLKIIGFIAFMICLLAFNPIYGQNQTLTNALTISGLVSDADGPLNGVNIVQKGTRNGTTTNAKGEFKFPVKLKPGDVLLFSYLGYEKQEIIIKSNRVFIKVALTEDLVEMIGALDTNTPYKTKRKKQ